MNINFLFSERDVVAKLTTNNKPLTALDLRDILEKQSFVDYYVNEDAIEELLKASRFPNREVSFTIAQKKDSQLIVEVEPDKKQAYLTITQSYGGMKPTSESILGVLKSHGVVYGILPEVIEKAVSEGKLERTIIAKFLPPIHGDDAKFEPLVEDSQDKGRPKILEDGTADFHDLSIVTTVNIGDPLMIKIPHTEGEPGINVCGEKIPQKVGKDKTFGIGKGSEVSKNNPNLLIATESGQPKIRSNYVSVEPIFHIKSIDYSSGNINFPGTVIVKNGIQSNFVVKTSGDLYVSGTVEGAIINSNGNILLRSGIVGNKQAKIKAHGNIQARFIESSIVESDSSIYVSDMIMHSDVIAFDKVEVGGKGGRGQIVGGTTKARSLVKARILGGPGSGHTDIEVGIDPFLQRKLDKIQKKLEKYKTKLDDIIKSTIYAKVNKKDFVKELELVREQLLLKIHDLSEKELILKKRLEKPTHGKIIVSEKIYAGVNMRIGNHKKTFTIDSPGGTFYISNDEIVLGSI